MSLLYSPIAAFALLAAVTLPASAQDFDTRLEYHSVLRPGWSLHQDAEAPKRPLYVVGLEKLRRTIAPELLVHRMDNDAKRPCVAEDFNCLRLSAAPKDLASDIREFVRHEKVLWPTHIARIREDRSACALFSLYSLATPDCAAGGATAAETLDATKTALDRLDATITADIDDARHAGKPISHIVLLITGWNTFQDESAKNFAQWAASLESERPATFNPIYVGISWQSTWGKGEGTSGGILSTSSFANKSNDADEVGFTWANQLLNRHLITIAAASDLSVLVIGHSFGTRIAAAAIHGRSLLQGLKDVDSAPAVTFVALQPAFSVNRVNPDKDESFYTRRLPAIPESRSFFTASSRDLATAKGNAVLGLVGKKPYLSSPQLLQAFGAGSPPSYLAPLELWKVLCAPAACSNSVPIQLTPPSTAACTRVPLIDASAIVSDGDGVSGAHSDVYDRPAAQLIFKLMNACMTSFRP